MLLVREHAVASVSYPQNSLAHLISSSPSTTKFPPLPHGSPIVVQLGSAPSTLQEWLPPATRDPPSAPSGLDLSVVRHFLPTSTSTEHPSLRNVFDITVWSFPCLDNDALLSLHCPSSFLPHNHLHVAPGLTQESCASLLPLYLQQNSGHGQGRRGVPETRIPG